jgi:hypothetical protein
VAEVGDLAQGIVRFAAAQADRATRAVLSLVIRKVLEQLDLTALVRERVDLDAVAEGIDVDAVASRLDVDKVVARVDIDRIVDRVDIDRIVDRVDIDRILDRVDIERIVARLDVNAVAEDVDLDAIVGRLDLIGLANYVVDGIDLPGIVRESSGSMASEALSGVRLQSLQADEALARAVSRWLPRRRGAHIPPVPKGIEGP